MPRVSNSRPASPRPTARTIPVVCWSVLPALACGVGVAVAVGVGVRVGVGCGVAVGDGVGCGVAVGDGVGCGVAVGDGVGSGVGVIVGVAVAKMPGVGVVWIWRRLDGDGSGAKIGEDEVCEV